MGLFSAILYSILLFTLWKIVEYFFVKDSVTNPFQNDSRKPKKPLVIDQKKRNEILKQNFKLEKVPSGLDAIVIGSGIGGLSTAAILSKTGKKVLVLEQHDQAGGCCHTFIEKGYEFDVGIHYIGEMNQQSVSKTLLDQISDGQILWEPLSDEFDTVVFAGKDDQPARHYPIHSDKKKQKQILKDHFPGEEEAIDKYFDLTSKAHTAFRESFMVKFLPLWLVKLLIQTGLIHLLCSFFKMNEKTVKEVVDELTSNQKLRAIFSYCFGDYGVLPSEAGFPMQAALTEHFMGGTFYPVGGASEIAHNIIPVIESGGGKVLVQAEVTEILVKADGVATGVRVRHGSQEYNIQAPIVVSTAGLYNTFLKFLRKDIADKSRLLPLTTKKRGLAAISVFVGLDAPSEEMGVAQKRNLWVFNAEDTDEACSHYLQLNYDQVEDADIPLMFISFPSTKDPTWDSRYPGKTTMAIVTFANYEWFKDWESKPCLRRGDDYEALKKTLGWKMIGQACKLFPKIKDHIDYVSVGSPLSNNFYLGSTRGEIYGLHHDVGRFAALNSALLRPTTDIPGLYLSGQDVICCGFTGALFGGLICAQQILGRNVISDLERLQTKIKETKESKEE